MEPNARPTGTPLARPRRAERPTRGGPTPTSTPPLSFRSPTPPRFSKPARARKYFEWFPPLQKQSDGTREKGVRETGNGLKGGRVAQMCMRVHICSALRRCVPRSSQLLCLAPLGMDELCGTAHGLTGESLQVTGPSVTT